MALDRSPKVSIRADCDGAPEKQLLRDLNIAFARADVDGILACFSDDICWRIMGETEIQGKMAARATLTAMADLVISELVIHSIITDGREAAVSGVITSESGESVAFCDVCQFASSAGEAIKKMTSYTVAVKTED
ncbi:MAG: nuclear transport factor 2 family protein [Chloroflexi bacterium]|nr:nuclear transport factor 2 family protein [Chloroflexota bacterium]